MSNTNSDSQLDDATRGNLAGSSEKRPTPSKVQYDDRLLTASFADQIKLVDRSTAGGNGKDDELPATSEPTASPTRRKKREKKKSQQFNPRQDSNVVFTNRSRKFRFGDDNIDQSVEKGPTCIEKVVESDTRETVAQEDTSSSKTSKQSRCVMPPPVDFTKFPQVESEDEAHSSMLMSWYMAGYHTGYFQAMKKFK